MMFKTNRRTKNKFALGPKSYETMSDALIGANECKTIDVNLPLDDRVVAEVAQYSQRYGFASWGDIVYEWNARCKDLQNQGEVYRYAYTDIPLIQGALDRLVKQGRIKLIEEDGIKGYYVKRKEEY